MLKKLLLSAVLLSNIALAESIKLGVMSGQEAEVAQVAANVAKAKFGLDIELVQFTDFVIPNEALNSGDIDLNAFQHRPYLEKQIAERGYKLAVVGKTFIYPIAGYSKKIKNIKDLKDGATIAIPNDPTNLARSLLLLQQEGLIKLENGGTLESTVLDISDNPHKFVIQEVEAPMLTHTLEDVDLAIINVTFATQVGLISTRDGLIIENKDSAYTNLVVARKGDENKPFAQQFLQAYQSKEVEEKAQEMFKGSQVKGW
jgi:D-methionine transport system substrate-binding protein